MGTVYNIYPKKLSELLLQKSGKNYIPRKIRENEFLKLFHSYWTPEFNSIFKVESIFNEGDYIYYHIKYGNSAYYGILSYPINPDCCFELFLNKSNIGPDINIINNNKFYSGAEIKYWFFLTINDSNSEIYKCFAPNICSNGKAQLQDSRYYKVCASLENNIYTKPQFISDKYNR